jgi:hypothetical protein
MSGKASAKIMENIEDILDGLDVDMDIDVLEPCLFIGEPIDGADIFIVVHTCEFCRRKMQTMGVGHGVYYCSWCASKRGRHIEMKRSYEPLEVLE